MLRGYTKQGKDKFAFNSNGVPETWFINEAYLSDIERKNGLTKWKQIY